MTMQDPGLGMLPGIGTVPTIQQTFRGSPAALWQAARIQQMEDQAYLPQFARTAMQGYRPAIGGYMLGGGTGTFADYLKGVSDSSISAKTASEAREANWLRAVEASRRIGKDPEYISPTYYGDLDFDTALAYQGYINPGLEGLSATEARANALTMAGTAQGRAGGGYADLAHQRALGNLYDLYAARAAGAGNPEGGFLGYLAGLQQAKRNPAPPTTAPPKELPPTVIDPRAKVPPYIDFPIQDFRYTDPKTLL